MIIKITHRPTNQTKQMTLLPAMLVYGLTPRNIIELDAGYTLGNENYAFECVERLA